MICLVRIGIETALYINEKEGIIYIRFVTIRAVQRHDNHRGSTYPPTGPDHQSPKKNSLITKILIYYESVDSRLVI